MSSTARRFARMKQAMAVRGIDLQQAGEGYVAKIRMRLIGADELREMGCSAGTVGEIENSLNCALHMLGVPLVVAGMRRRIDPADGRWIYNFDAEHAIKGAVLGMERVGELPPEAGFREIMEAWFIDQLDVIETMEPTTLPEMPMGRFGLN